MIEVKTVLELAKEMPPYQVGKMTGYTTAQVKNMLTKNRMKPYKARRVDYRVPRITGERRQALIERMKHIVRHKKEFNVSTLDAVNSLGIKMCHMQANNWIRKLKASGEL